MDRLRKMKPWDRGIPTPATVPLVVINKNGIFSLNGAAFKAMGEPMMVEIFYDEGKSIIALAPAESDSRAGYPPRKVGTGATWYITGREFTHYHGIDTSIARRYPVEVQDRILFIDLTGPNTMATRYRKRTA